MSSMVWDAYEMGITPELGGMPSDSFYRDTDKKSYIEEEPTWFATAKEAQDYAKANPGIVITRSSNGNGYIVKNNMRNQ